MNQIVISVSNLTKTFSGKEVIRNCTFSVKQGSIYGFLGRNGAGKTTMLKLLLGLLKPSAGTASVLGLDSVRDNEAIQAPPTPRKRSAPAFQSRSSPLSPQADAPGKENIGLR